MASPQYSSPSQSTPQCPSSPSLPGRSHRTLAAAPTMPPIGRALAREESRPSTHALTRTGREQPPAAGRARPAGTPRKPPARLRGRRSPAIVARGWSGRRPAGAMAARGQSSGGGRGLCSALSWVKGRGSLQMLRMCRTACVCVCLSSQSTGAMGARRNTRVQTLHLHAVGEKVGK